MRIKFIDYHAHKKTSERYTPISPEAIHKELYADLDSFT